MPEREPQFLKQEMRQKESPGLEKSSENLELQREGGADLFRRVCR